ncbi:glycosyltransferase family 2 protein [Trinickia diaoshuihuensis]|jgi:GT2 family glycosyltransferase|uniref:glycosyltransferase family 2 protein n=1 Tax=Trinickia diaoshuihuensis TaxID=2292265 RepID=UPI000E22F9F9|nr:glycosyltransferase [Trinickia diaoshuihuensis]
MDTLESAGTLTTRISVVVLTHNRIQEVLRTVERLLALPERPTVIVVDNGSTDGTAQRLTLRFPQVRVIASACNLGAAGRNLGVAAATTDYVAFSDDDTHWSPGSLAHAVRVLDDAPRVAVLSGRVLVGETGELDPTCIEMQTSPLERGLLPGPALVGYMAGACVFRAGAFRVVGGYEPRLFIGGEESLVSLDLLDRGYAIVYCDAIAVTHHPSPARDARLRRRMLARNAALVAWLRLPLSEAYAATARALTVCARERSLGRDLWALAAGIVWAIRRRRLVSDAVLAMRSRVRDAQRGRVNATKARSGAGAATVEPER